MLAAFMRSPIAINADSQVADNRLPKKAQSDMVADHPSGLNQAEVRITIAGSF